MENNNEENINTISPEVPVEQPPVPEETPAQSEIPAMTVEPQQVSSAVVNQTQTIDIEKTTIMDPITSETIGSPTPVEVQPVVTPELSVAEQPVTPTPVEVTPNVEPPINSPVVEAVAPEENVNVTLSNIANGANETAEVKEITTENKKSKIGIYVLVAILLIVVVAAIYILLTADKKEQEEPKQKEEQEVAEVNTDYYYQQVGQLTYELAFYNDGTYTLYRAGVLETELGTYVLEENTYTLTGQKIYNSNNVNCYNNYINTITLTLNEDGTLTGFIGEEEYNFAKEETGVNIKNFEANHGNTICEENSDQNEETVVEEETEDEEITTEETVIEVNKITLNLTKKTIKVGETVTLTATLDPTDATNQTITWKSSNTKVATVKNGVVTSVAAGTAKITATTSNNKTATFTLTVEEEEEEVSTCTYNGVTYNLSEVRDEAGNTTAYKKFKKAINDAGNAAGEAAAPQCKTLNQIIIEVQSAVREVAEHCWDSTLVTKAVEAAKCQLIPGCDKTSQYGSDAIFKQKNQDDIMSVWSSNNCTNTYTYN